MLFGLIGIHHRIFSAWLNGNPAKPTGCLKIAYADQRPQERRLINNVGLILHSDFNSNLGVWAVKACSYTAFRLGYTAN
jgi:hypothetical protein